MSLLGDASARLGASLDWESTLRRVTELPLPVLADACVLQLLGSGGDRGPGAPAADAAFERVLVAHVDDARAREARQLAATSPRAGQLVEGALEVLRTGRLHQVADLSAGHPLMRALGARSTLSLPLRAGGALVGVWTLLRCQPAHPARVAMLAEDHALLSELAQRAGTVLGNTLLYRDAQDALALRDHLLAAVSHDLQSPLNAIAMTVRRLTGDPQLAAGVRVQRALALVERTTRHLGQLIEELLEVGSMHAGKLSLRCRPTELAGLIHEAIAMQEPLWQERRLRVTTRLEPGLPRAWCDAERVLRVLMNLLGNALKFSDEGGEVLVRARVAEGQLEVSIRDRGAGIAGEELPKLFQPYWRSRSAGARGTGLGLYIARGIMEAHGGRIWAESQPELGSTFCFRLAIAPDEPTQPM